MEWIHIILINCSFVSIIFASINLFSYNTETEAIVTGRQYNFNECFIKITYLTSISKTIAFHDCMVDKITIYYNYFNPELCSTHQSGSLLAGIIFIAMCVLYSSSLLVLFILKRKRVRIIDTNECVVPSYNLAYGSSENGKFSVLIVNP